MSYETPRSSEKSFLIGPKALSMSNWRHFLIMAPACKNSLFWFWGHLFTHNFEQGISILLLGFTTFLTDLYVRYFFPTVVLGVYVFTYI